MKPERNDASCQFTPPPNGKWAILLYILERYGVPSLLLAIVGWWFASRVADPLIASHSAFLMEQVKISRDQGETLRHISKVLDSRTEVFLGIERFGERQVTILEQNQQLIKEVLTTTKARDGGKQN